MEITLSVVLSFLLTALTYISFTYVFIHFILLDDRRKPNPQRSRQSRSMSKQTKSTKKIAQTSSSTQNFASIVPLPSGALLLPGPIPLPVIGNLHQLKDPMHVTFNQMTETYGPIFQVRMGSQQWVILNDHEIAHDLFVRRSDIYTPKASNQKCVATNGIHSKSMRSLAQKALSPILIETNYLPTIHECVKDFVCQLDKNSQHPIDPAEWLRECVVNALAIITYGNAAISYTSEFDTILRDFHAMESKTNYFDALPWLRNLPSSNKIETEARESMARFEEISIKLVSDLRKKIAAKDSTTQKCFAGQVLKSLKTGRITKSRPIVIPSQLAEKEASGDTFDEQDLTNLNGTLLCGGTSTTVAEMRWILIILAYLPHVRQQIQREMDAAVGKGKFPEPKDYVNLPYLRATIKEVLRFRPVGFFSQPRETTVDDVYHGYHIPAKATVVLNTNPLHFSRKLYEFPKRFIPERYLDEQGKLKEQDQFVNPWTFGAGPLTNFGDHLAEMCLCSITAYILVFFDLELENDPETGEPFEIDMCGTSHGLELSAPQYKLKFLCRNMEIVRALESN